MTELRSVLSSLRDRAKAVRAERDGLLRQVVALNKTIADLDLQCGQLANEVLPISSLPCEILGRIFEAGPHGSNLAESDLAAKVRSAFSQVLRGNDHTAKPFELLVSQISKHFRSVALATPNLWRTINIHFSNSSHWSMAAAYLDRSGVLSVDIGMSLEGSTLTNIVGDMKSITSLINLHVNRWRRLFIRSKEPMGALEFLDSIQLLKAPVLRDFEILCAPSLAFENDEAFSCPNSFAGGTPSLSSVRLRGVPFTFSLGSLSSLKTLHIHSTHNTGALSTLHDILVGLPALEDLAISGYFNNPIPDTSFDLPSLQSLKISGTITAYTLKALCAPGLRSLFLESVHYADLKLYISNLPLGYCPQFPVLRSLTLFSYEDFTRSAWADLMRAFPTIEDFTFLGNIHELLSFLQEMDEASPQSVRWPQLYTVTLHDSAHGEYTIDPVLLRQAIAARAACGYPIRKLRLSRRVLSKLREELPEQLRLEELKMSEVGGLFGDIAF